MKKIIGGIIFFGFFIALEVILISIRFWWILPLSFVLTAILVTGGYLLFED